MKYGYARVSTDDQSTALQLAALKRAGCKTFFKDQGLSGATTKRPALLRCLKALHDGDTGHLHCDLRREAKGDSRLVVCMEKVGVDTRQQVQAMVRPSQELTLNFTPVVAQGLISASNGGGVQQIDSDRASLAIIYSYGDFTAATS